MLAEHILNDELDLIRVELEARRLERAAWVQDLEDGRERGIHSPHGLVDNDGQLMTRNEVETTLLEERYRLLEMQNGHTPKFIPHRNDFYRSTVLPDWKRHKKGPDCGNSQGDYGKNHEQADYSPAA